MAKYADHLPLYRQSEIYARAGLELQRSTLADWVGQSAALLRPLIDALARHVLAAAVLHADDTPVPVLAPGLGKTRTGRLWAYLRDERPHGSTTPPAVLYRYSPDRRAEHPKAHLAGFRGVLQADGYSGFDGLYDGGQVQEAACRVGGDVAAPTPHRPGRADFPHPVLHGRASLGTSYWRMILADGRGWRLSSSRRRSQRKFPCRPLRDSHFFQIRST